MSKDDLLEFTLERKCVPVKLKNPTTGEIKCYALRELDGKSRDQHMNDVGKRMRAEGKGIGDFTDLHANLIAKSLYECEHEEVDGVVRVKEGTIGASISLVNARNLPGRVQAALFQKAQELSGLEVKKEDDDEKNS